MLKHSSRRVAATIVAMIRLAESKAACTVNRAFVLHITRHD